MGWAACSGACFKSPEWSPDWIVVVVVVVVSVWALSECMSTAPSRGTKVTESVRLFVCLCVCLLLLFSTHIDRVKRLCQRNTTGHCGLQIGTAPTQLKSATYTLRSLAIRRIKRWEAMTEHYRAHLQTVAAIIWGQLPGEPQTLTAEGFLSHSEPIYGGFL